MDMTFRPMTPTERMYSYTQSQQLIMQTGCIGHLRADFGSNNKQFFTSWDDHRTDLKSDDFKQEFDEVINALREDDKYGSVLTACPFYFKEDFAMKTKNIYMKPAPPD